ncbi:MAG TPA: D-glycerate dehydrogenase [Hanamia sp.]|nr:D-glycerate dehydrogenase [Hanamia sp.]
MKVFITRLIPEAGLKKLRDAGIEIVQWNEKRELTQPELIEHCQQCDALLAAGYNKMDAHFLNECRNLKVIALHSVGYDNVDIAEADKLKIPIGNTPGILSGPTADIAFLLMLAVSRKAFYLHEKIVKGDWKFFEPTANLGIQLYGKTLGIFGLGNIGFEMAKRCIGAYDMKVIYHNRHRNFAMEKELNAELVSFDLLLKNSDVLSVHSNLSSSTRGKFDRSAFEKMKRTSIFINTARGAMHNEEDLIEALKNGIIWGAGLDVTNPEPMKKDNPLLTMPNAAVLPHIGSATVETRNAMASIAAENIIAGLHGKRIPYPVNPEVYDGS